jgi:type I restriction enzyme S subunit
MEVKAGYKHTDVGVFPEEWEVRPLFGVVKAATGQVSPREEPYRSMVLVAPDHIEEATGRLLAKETAAAQGAISGKYLFKPGDIVYSKIRPYLRKAILADFEGLCSADMYPLTPAKDVCSAFVFAVLLGHDFSNFAATVSARSGIPKINRDELAQYTLALPPLPEQRGIAGALSDVDALIGALDQLIAKKRDLKQAAMQRLLTGQTRLPGFHGEWEPIQFSDIADRWIPWSIGGGPFGSNLKASDYTDEGVRIIQLQNIGDGCFHDDYAIYTSEAKADELLSNNIYPGEIILSKMGDPVARACFVPTADRRYLMASDGIRLAVDSRRFNKRFVHDYINSVHFRKKAIEASTGSTRQRIGLVELKQLPFIAPPLDEQTAIAEVLSDMDEELSALEQRRDKTRALKQGMMQQLLTGRRRLI